MKKKVFAILAGMLAITLVASPFTSMKAYAEPAEVLEVEEEDEAEKEDTEFADPNEFFEVLLEAIEARNANIESSEVLDVDDEIVYRFTKEYEIVAEYEKAIFEEKDLDAAVQIYFNALKSLMLDEPFVDYYSIDQPDRSYVFELAGASLYYAALDYIQENYDLELPEEEVDSIEGMYEFYVPFLEHMRGDSDSTEPASVHEPEDDEEASEAASEKSFDIIFEDDGSGEDKDDEQGIKECYVTDRDLAFEGECGPIMYTINSIQIADMIIHDESTANILDVEMDESFVLIGIDITVENTSEDDVNFYPEDSTIITNTKAQIDANYWTSDSFGKFMGEVEKNGQIFFIIPGEEAESITSFTWRIDAPYDSNSYEDVGEDIKISFGIKEEP